METLKKLVTGRSNNTQDLKESERKLRDLLNNLDIGIVLLDHQAKIIFYNPEAHSLLGLDVDQLLAKTLFDPDSNLVYEDGTPFSEATHLITQAMETGQSVRNVVMGVYRKEKGDRIWLSFDAIPQFKDDHTLEMVVCTFRDITECKLSEKAMQESEEKYKYIFDHSIIGKSITLPTGEMHVNNAMCIITGYSAEELTNTKWQQITHPDDIESIEKIIGSILSGERESAHFRKRYIHKNGSVIWTDMTTSLRRDADGKPFYFMTSINDITEQMQLEAELHLKSEIMSHMAEAVYLVRMENGIIVYSNPQFEKLFGYGPGEMIGKHVSIVNAPTDKSPEDTAKEIMKSLSDHGYWKGEVKNIKKDGTTLWCYANVSIFDHSQFGKVLVSVHTDITDRKKSESKIRKLNDELEQRVMQRTEELVAANKELEAFSYSVSHDLRAPLRAIHSFSSILMEDYHEKLDDDGKRFCEIIESRSIHMGQLIDDLLAFSRAGRTELLMSRINMTSMVNTVFQELTIPEERKRVALSVKNLPDIYGDPTTLKLVWTNLISNALKYTSNQETPHIQVGYTHEKKEVIYYVEDNGAGFDRKYSEKLFKVFQRLHSQKEFEGNGVGLAIIKRIVNRHEGRVWAEGEVSKGAKFYFALPVKNHRRNKKKCNNKDK